MNTGTLQCEDCVVLSSCREELLKIVPPGIEPQNFITTMSAQQARQWGWYNTKRYGDQVFASHIDWLIWLFPEYGEILLKQKGFPRINYKDWPVAIVAIRTRIITHLPNLATLDDPSLVASISYGFLESIGLGRVLKGGYVESVSSLLLALYPERGWKGVRLSQPKNMRKSQDQEILRFKSRHPHLDRDTILHTGRELATQVIGQTKLCRYFKGFFPFIQLCYPEYDFKEFEFTNFGRRLRLTRVDMTGNEGENSVFFRTKEGFERCLKLCVESGWTTEYSSITLLVMIQFWKNLVKIGNSIHEYELKTIWDSSLKYVQILVRQRPGYDGEDLIAYLSATVADDNGPTNHKNG